jgi:uncharacterized protein YndB with AHSA1/START domain
MNGTIATAWALVCLAGAAALLAASARIGRPRAAGWLVVLGVAMLTIEEAGLTLWLALTDPAGDPEGVAGLVTPVARAHIIDAAVFGLAVAVLLSWIALTALRRGESWARRVLAYSLAVAVLTEVATTVFVSSRGLPLPVPAEPAAFGWQPVAVALLAWAAGLWLAATVHGGRGLAATREIAAPPEHAYAAVLSGDGLRAWFAGVSTVDVDAGWPAPGTGMRWTVRGAGRFEATVAAADPPRSVALDVRTPSGRSRITHTFAAQPSGRTHYTKTVVPTYRGWARPLAPLLDAVLRRAVRAEVTRAARYATMEHLRDAASSH